MTCVSLVFRTEPGQATPRLKHQPGSSAVWPDADLRALESDLARQYPDLIRGRVDTVTFQGRPLRVTVEQDANSRMPAVLLTDEPPVKTGPHAGSGWLAELLGELDRLTVDAKGAGPDPLERAMLRCVSDELRAMAGQAGPGMVAVLLLGGHLAGAEQMARPTDPERAGVYALALRGLDKLLTNAGPDDTARPARASGGPAPQGAVGRVLRRLLGLSGVGG